MSGRRTAQVYYNKSCYEKKPKRLAYIRPGTTGRSTPLRIRERSEQFNIDFDSFGPKTCEKPSDLEITRSALKKTFTRTVCDLS